VATQAGDRAKHAIVIPQFSEGGIGHPKPRASSVRLSLGYKDQLVCIRVR